LGCVAEGGCVEEAQDLEAELGGEGGDEVNLDESADGGGDEGELGKAALGEDALQHKVAVSGRSSGEESPHTGYALLVGLRFTAEFLLMSITAIVVMRRGSWYLLELLHGRLVCLSPAERVGAMAVAVLCVGIAWEGIVAVSVVAAQRIVLVGDVLGQIGRHHVLDLLGLFLVDVV
jgi:hypothetical protein